MLILITAMLLASCEISETNTNRNDSHSIMTEPHSTTASESITETAELERTPSPTSTIGKASSAAVDNDNIVNTYHPIVFIHKNYKGEFRNIIFGGSKEGKWYNVEDFKLPSDHSLLEDFSTKLAKGDESYKLYSDSKYITTSAGIKPKLYYVELCGSHVIDPQIDPMTPDEDYLIGVNCDWDALPRMPEILEPGIKLIDLDNDGENEKLTITETQDPKSKDIIKNVLVYVEKNNNKILELDFDLDDTYTTKYKIFTLDLDGDGKMEIVNASTGYLTYISVYQLSENAFSKVLSYYLGD